MKVKDQKNQPRGLFHGYNHDAVVSYMVWIWGFIWRTVTSWEKDSPNSILDCSMTLLFGWPIDSVGSRFSLRYLRRYSSISNLCRALCFAERAASWYYPHGAFQASIRKPNRIESRNGAYWVPGGLGTRSSPSGFQFPAFIFIQTSYAPMIHLSRLWPFRPRLHCGALPFARQGSVWIWRTVKSAKWPFSAGIRVFLRVLIPSKARSSDYQGV